MFKRQPKPKNILPVGMDYCKEAPTNQTMVDILHGEWFSAFPDEYQVTAGGLKTFDFAVDTRVKWCNDILSNRVNGSTILELGPFEAYNTWQFEQLGAKSVLAIENNNINFIKCLIVKEITRMKSRFLYGDFIPFLEKCAERFDIVWASGVLYHQTEPIKLLGLISKVTDRVFVHTHYYIDDIIKHYPYASDFIPGRDSVENYGGFHARLHYRSYEREIKSIMPQRRAYSGGSEEFSYWMEKEDIFASLKHFGFDQFIMGVDDPANPMGPAMYFVAEKSGANRMGI